MLNRGLPVIGSEYRRILCEYLRHFEEKGWAKAALKIVYNLQKDYRFFPSTQDGICYQHDEKAAEALYDSICGTYEHSGAKMVLRADSSSYGNHFDKYRDMPGLSGAAIMKPSPPKSF